MTAPGFLKRVGTSPHCIIQHLTDARINFTNLLGYFTADDLLAVSHFSEESLLTKSDFGGYILTLSREECIITKPYYGTAGTAAN